MSNNFANPAEPVADCTSKPCPTCRSFMNAGGHCPDPWHRPRPAADLPDSLQRPRRARAADNGPAAVGGAAGIASRLPADVDPIAYLEKRLGFAWTEIDRIGDLALTMRAERDRALRVVDAARAAVASGEIGPNARLARRVQEYDEKAPGTGLKSTESAPQASRAESDRETAQGLSGRCANPDVDCLVRQFVQIREETNRG